MTQWPFRIETSVLSRETLPGILGSLLLHGIALAVILLLLANRTRQQPEALLPFVPVDLVALGERTSGPPVPASAAAPQEKAMRGPAAAPRPEGVSPRGAHPARDSLALRLRKLARLRQPDSDLRIENQGTSDMAATSPGAAVGPPAYSLRDYIRAQVLRRWNLDLTALGNRHLVVGLHVVLTRHGTVASITILDQNRYKHDAVFRQIALSARNAVLLSAPFTPPGGLPHDGLDIRLNLDPRNTLR